IVSSGTTATLNAATGLTATASTLTAGTGLLANTATGALALNDSIVTAGTTLGLTATAGTLTQTDGTVSGAGGVTLQAATGIGIIKSNPTGPVLRSTTGSLTAVTDAGAITVTGATLGSGT